MKSSSSLKVCDGLTQALNRAHEAHDRRTMPARLACDSALSHAKKVLREVLGKCDTKESTEAYDGATAAYDEAVARAYEALDVDTEGDDQRLLQAYDKACKALINNINKATDEDRKAPAVIVSRHPAAVEFVQAEHPELAGCKVLESATSDDVEGRVVYGNLPLFLAATAAKVVAIEFTGPPPRGAEYGVDEMRAAGARLVGYKVTAIAS